jgi:hypothetical protein
MRLLLVAFFAFGLALGSSGCLGVDSPDGALICNNDTPERACPQGFYCLAPDNHCWRYGHFPEDMASPGRWNPGGPPDDLSVPLGDDLSPGPDDLSQTD